MKQKITQILMALGVGFGAVALAMVSIKKITDIDSKDVGETYTYDNGEHKFKVPHSKGSPEAARYIKDKKKELENEEDQSNKV